MEIMRKLTISKVLLLIFTTIIIQSCKNQEEPEATWYSNHAIQKYIMPDSITDLTWKFIGEDTILVGFCLNGENVLSGEAPNDAENKHPMYDYFVKKYHDTSWGGRTFYFACAIAYPIENISIVADKDYDENHYAGDDLNDVLFVGIQSWGEFVLNDYPKNMEHCQYVEKPFKDFSKNEKSLWYGGIGFRLPKPTLSKDFNLTITITFEEGRTLSTTTHIEF
ncbi:MAG: DUF5034 domain-containing protein [Paludibacteraceae bacterium]|nr:DUF5034 domain-containing protein [Paludibacteraceae bacterium]